MARGVAISLEPLERREFRRLLVVSCLAHAALALFLGVSPSGEVVMPQGVIAVELVAMPAPARARAGRPAPAPKPAEPAGAAAAAARAEAGRAAQGAGAAAARAEAGGRAESRSRSRKPEPVAEPAPEKDYADVLSELRDEVGDEPPAARRAAPAPARRRRAAIGSPTGSRCPPEFLAWERRARIHIRQNWVVPPASATSRCAPASRSSSTPAAASSASRAS